MYLYIVTGAHGRRRREGGQPDIYNYICMPIYIHAYLHTSLSKYVYVYVYRPSTPFSLPSRCTWTVAHNDIPI